MKYSLMLVALATFLSCSNSNSTTSTSSKTTDDSGHVETSTSTDMVQNDASPENPNAPSVAGTTVIEFEKTEHDFGTVNEGDIVEYNFKFRNAGTNDLLISTVEASCGCTTPDWPKKPIKPGAVEYINAKFNTEGKGGKNVKKITVIANTNPPHNELTLTGQVNARK